MPLQKSCAENSIGAMPRAIDLDQGLRLPETVKDPRGAATATHSKRRLFHESVLSKLEAKISTAIQIVKNQIDVSECARKSKCIPATRPAEAAVVGQLRPRATKNGFRSLEPGSSGGEYSAVMSTLTPLGEAVGQPVNGVHRRITKVTS
jgi:hypothetical protein